MTQRHFVQLVKISALSSSSEKPGELSPPTLSLSHKSATPLSPTNPMATLPTLPLELLTQITFHLPTYADMVCFSLAHPVFRAIYQPSNTKRNNLTVQRLRARLERDAPLLYFCECGSASFLCRKHGFDYITAMTPLSAFGRIVFNQYTNEDYIRGAAERYQAAGEEIGLAAMFLKDW